MSWSNYDDVLAQLSQAGLQVDAIEVGKLKRCKVEGDREKRGWYSLHELRLDGGDIVLVGTFGIWRGAEANAQKVDLRKREITAEQRALLKARIAEDRKVAERHRKAEAARAAMRAQRVWELCARDGDADYLRRKGVGAHGVRFSPKGAVVVPMLDVQGRVHGLQFIHATKRHGRDKDFWPAGLAKLGHYFHLGPQPTLVMLIAEGYATAASLFEATGWPVAVAFDAGNLVPVATALAKRYRGLRLLVCGDDDYLTDGNPGATHAANAALAAHGHWMVPVFAVDRGGQKITDFNDLHHAEGLHAVRAQVEAKLRQVGWADGATAARAAGPGGRGDAAAEDGQAADLQPIDSVDQLHERYVLVYEMPDTVFDAQEHKLVPLSSMRNLCTSRMVHRAWMDSAAKRVVRVEEVGFDPACEDPRLKCNLWGGWPTVPKAGDCDCILELLHHLCKDEANPDEVYQWVMRWLAYPIQYPGTKLKTALVVHGPQGSGKNMFFEAVMGIYGSFGRVIDQAAVEDKFNDWASRKLFLIADEVVARAELYHIKNKLKGLITGDSIRINPKNLGAYEERNHVNMVILSNEVMPAVLERDDRRYMVIWTPPKLDPGFYEQVRIEIANGGIAALHEHLRTLPLGDFKPWTLPPITNAKRDLIAASMGSSERFHRDWMGRELPLPIVPCRSEDLFDAYRYWCGRTGSRHPAINVFVAEVVKLGRMVSARRRHTIGQTTKQSTVIYPETFDSALSGVELGDHVADFAESVRLWKRDTAGSVL